MKTLDKNSRNYILELIKENSLKSILAFCQGYGIDTIVIQVLFIIAMAS